MTACMVCGCSPEAHENAAGGLGACDGDEDGGCVEECVQYEEDETYDENAP